MHLIKDVLHTFFNKIMKKVTDVSICIFKSNTKNLTTTQNKSKIQYEVDTFKKKTDKIRNFFI